MQPINILLVEDNEGDILLTTEAFEDSKIANKLNVIKDGQKAIEFFEKLIDESQLPNLMILDVNLPRISGHEVLAYLKGHKKYKSIPVIMFSTSSSESDIAASYNNHVNCYITKPYDSRDFTEVIQKIQDFWIKTATISGQA